ncbi:hypothetical protein RF11_08875 [Thelohanellus kitauei]|uniref:Uncharacterized protein n=1 Tax=Thelohanellus kitauei TaxID=669202 RepID=A0A0C2JIL7_THEKT|nr:hypothetical protein RF11_08875 [Thelohanellus kitauei]
MIKLDYVKIPPRWKTKEFAPVNVHSPSNMVNDKSIRRDSGQKFYADRSNTRPNYEEKVFYSEVWIKVRMYSNNLFVQFFDPKRTVMELYKPAPMHYCTNFTLTAIVMLFTCDRGAFRVGTHPQTHYGIARLTLAKHSSPSL